MRIRSDTPIDELEHSEIEYGRVTGDMTMDELMHAMGYSYVDLDEDELFHWKYIKREKVNGKWRYWYKDTLESIDNAIDSAKDKVKDASAYAKKELVTTAKNHNMGEHTTVKDGKKWLSRSFGLNKDIGGGRTEYKRVYERGKLERASVAGKAFLSYLFGDANGKDNSYGKTLKRSGSGYHQRMQDEQRSYDKRETRKTSISADISKSGVSTAAANVKNRKDIRNRVRSVNKLASSATKGKVSKEYLEEYSYNTKTNPGTLKTGDRQSSSTSKSSAAKGKVSKEYLEEYSYNTKTNPGTLKTGDRQSTTTSRPSTTKGQTSKEYREELEYNKRRNRNRRR